MTKEQLMARFIRKETLVIDSVRNEWVRPYKADEVKTSYSSDMALFTPVKFK